MKKIFNIITGVFAVMSLLLSACGSTVTNDDDVFNVLASTSFLADMAQSVAGDRVQVQSLLPFGADTHAYQATPADVTKIAKSDFLILNGVEYEHFIESLLENAGGERIIVEATAGLTPHEMEEYAGEEHEGEEHADEAESGEGHEHEAGDPHMWLDPNLVITYVENIRDGFIQADPEGAEIYTANANAYFEQLKDLDSWIMEQVDAIPSERKLLVTNHEAMGYFAERYGFEIVDTILPSFSSEANASAQEITEAIDAIKSSGASAIFLGEVENAELANQIADETGVKVIDNLYLESLTDGEPAGTYIDMMKHNVIQIVNALK